MDALDDHLDDFNTDEDAVIDLFRIMQPAEKAQVIARYRDKLANCLNFSEMRRALVHLNPPLETKLTWLKAASIMTRAISYGEIRSLITAAPGQVTALHTSTWKRFFIDVCDNRTIVTAVNDLRLPTIEKLRWIKEETSGINARWSEIRPIIVNVTDTDRAALLNDEWKSWFTWMTSGTAEIIQAVDALGFKLSDKITWVRAETLDIRLTLNDLRPMITAASQPERDIVGGDWWRPFWEAVCNNETMAEIVDLLFPNNIVRKLQWMVAEGTSWALVRAKVQGTPADQRPRVYDDGTLKTPLLTLLQPAEVVELVRLLAGDLVKQLQWLHAKGRATILLWINALPPAERVALYASTPAKGFLAANLSPEELVNAVVAMGGTSAQKVGLLLDHPGMTAPMMVRGITSIAAADRLLLYADTRFVTWVQARTDPDYTAIGSILGGTPTQQMTLFGPTRNMTALTWATPSQDWVDAIRTARTNPNDLLAAAGTNLAWAPFIKTSLAQIFAAGNVTVVGAPAVAMVWAAYGDGSGINAATSLLVFRALYGKTISAPGTNNLIFTGWSTGTPLTPARWRFVTVNPNDATARAFLAMVKPIPRGQVATGQIGFALQYYNENQNVAAGTWTGPLVTLSTSYAMGGNIVLKVDASGQMDTNIVDVDANGVARGVGGAGTGSALTWFQNHVRHEIGHAVGERNIGTMTQSGNEFARAYGNWTPSNPSTFEGAMWSPVTMPSGGWPSLEFGGGAQTINDTDVKTWLLGLISAGAEPAGKIRNGTLALTQKIAVLNGSLWSATELFKYVKAVVGGSDVPGRIPGAAYEFPGYTPISPVHIYSTREGNSFVTYDKGAHDELKSSTGWYSMSSHVEMFAEIYTRKYTNNTVPAEKNSKNWATFFTQLEAQEDPMFGASGH